MLMCPLDVRISIRVPPNRCPSQSFQGDLSLPTYSNIMMEYYELLFGNYYVLMIDNQTMTLPFLAIQCKITEYDPPFKL